MSRKLPFIVGLSLILVSGVAHGLWTGRWRSSHELADSAAKIAKVPATIGDWKSTDLETDPRELKQAGIVGVVQRRYVNTRTGAAVTMFLVSGPPGPISVHNPELCYPGVGYQQQATREEAAVGDDRFWYIRLSKRTNLSQSNIVVWYAWNAEGQWKAPKLDPRLSFAPFAALYKMYIIHEQRGGNFDIAETDGMQFAKDVLPEVKACLFDKK